MKYQKKIERNKKKNKTINKVNCNFLKKKLILNLPRIHKHIVKIANLKR